MLREVISSIGLNQLAEIALVFFLIAFVTICCWTLSLPRKSTDAMSMIPLHDRDQDQPNE